MVDHTMLLRPGDPAPFEVLNPGATRPVLLVCEHASQTLPGVLATAYPEALMQTHYGCDIGTRALIGRLASRLDARAIVANYSRIVIDCNRRLADPTLILTETEQGPVTANAALSDADREARIRDIYLPFHDGVSRELEQLRALGRAPVYVAIHSFTPSLTGAMRPWDIGVMWDVDRRLAARLIDVLRRQPGILVGDNEPYSGKYAADFSVDYHAERDGLANVAIEVRQDHLQSEAGIDQWAQRLGDALDGLLDAPDLATPGGEPPKDRNFALEASRLSALSHHRGEVGHGP